MTPRPPLARKGTPAPTLTGPFDPGGQPDLGPDKHLHLSLFAWNVSNGLSASKVVLDDPESRQNAWQWKNSQRLLRLLDSSGMDSALQYGMWVGYGGEVEWNDHHYDWATAGAITAAVTERVGIFQTIHVGYNISPMFIAKQTAAVDHVSGGRGGVNIVAGQNAVDYAQFGLEGPPPQPIRYAIADEMTTAMKLLWTSDEPVDFEGEYFQLYGAQISPRATSRPRPVLVNAAASPIGLDYATRQCDALFVTASGETWAEKAARIHGMAAEHNRKVRVAAMCYVVMDDDQSKVDDLVEEMRRRIDREALENWLTMSGHIMASEPGGENLVDKGLYGLDRQASGAAADPYLGLGKEDYEELGMGMGAYQLFGTYEKVADELIELYNLGIGQFALCFLDPMKGVQQMKERVIPILQSRGYNELATAL
ncbi:MAG: LLM class flavin-dependent oxidoreductase [Leucobacter sp.]